jgi:hypothetical protein
MARAKALPSRLCGMGQQPVALLLIVLVLRRPVARQFGAGVVYLLWAIPAARFFLPPRFGGGEGRVELSRDMPADAGRAS